MAQLPNFPFKNQLAEPIIDGLADQNADENCLPTCIAAGLQYELGGKQYTGSEIEHAVYGPNYHGGTAAVEYVHYVQSQGVAFTAENGSPAYLTGRIHYHLSCGRPVIGTIPSCYCPPQDRLNPGSSHCIIFYKDSLNPGVLIAMNPWQAISQGNTDQWWIDRLCYDQIWILDKKEKGTPHMGGIPQGWKDDGTTLVAPNGKRLEHGFRSYVMAHDWHPEDMPLEEEHSDPRGGTALVFMNERLRYEEKRGVYPEGLGIGTLEMQAQLKSAADKEAALQKELDVLKAAAPPPPTPAPQPQPQPDLLKQLNAIEGQLAGLIDNLSSSQ